MDSTIIDTVRIIVNESTNLYDLIEYTVGMAALVVILIIFFGNPFTKNEQ